MPSYDDFDSYSLGKIPLGPKEHANGGRGYCNAREDILNEAVQNDAQHADIQRGLQLTTIQEGRGRRGQERRGGISHDDK